MFSLKSRKHHAELVFLAGHRHSRLILYYVDYTVDCVLNEKKAAQIPKFLKKSTYIWCIMSSHVFLCAYYNNRGYKNANNKENGRIGDNRNKEK